ncbi:hypothetical protein FRC01_002742, partial [Tulasnella sp. 417]
MLRLGVIQQAESLYTGAGQSYTQALVAYTGVGDGVGRATVLDQIGELYQNQNRCPEAIGSDTRVPAICTSSEDNLGQANTLLLLGKTDQAEYSYSKAGQSYAQALTLHTGSGSQLGQANATQHHGQRERNPDSLNATPAGWLPDEIYQHILESLPDYTPERFQTLLACRLVCSHFKVIAEFPCLWARQYKLNWTYHDPVREAERAGEYESD